ncbi:MAG: copper-binding protein [Burkholderiales bacterium]|nr:copper-binding protein [Burkholderiales bacterium]
MQTFIKPALRTLATLAAGLTLSVAAWAQSVDGTVEKVDAEAGKVTLRHGEIKSIDMPPMKMAFRVADPAWLKTLQVGDKVKFDAAKVNGQFTITALTVVK